MKTGIIIFAFGQPETISSNLHLEVYGKQLAINLSVKNIFTQRDVGFKNSSNAIIVEYVEEMSKQPPSTLFIAQKSLAWAKKNGLEEVIIVAAPPHAWRCLRDTSKVYSGSGINVSLYKDIKAYVNSLWYNVESSQMRTRNWLFWWLREIILRLLPFTIYKKVAR